MGEYQLVPDISMNSAPVYRHTGGGGCLYYNNNNNWAVNKHEINPTEADIVNNKEDQSKDIPPVTGWQDNPTIKALRCHSSEKLTSPNPCTPPLTVMGKCILPPKEDEDRPKIDIFLNPEKAAAKNHIISLKMNQSNEYFKNSNMTTVFPELFHLLWFSSLPCTEDSTNQVMLKSCKVGGLEVQCGDYFSKVPTDLGMCCAINMEKSLKDSKYTKLIETMQNISENTGSGNAEKKTVAAAEGINNGLRVVLDLHSNFESFGSIENDFRAFRVYIGQPTEFPGLQKRSLVIEPGREHFIDLRSQVFSSSDGIKQLEPEKRNCFFSTEGSLEFYEEYTFTNCILECGIKAAENITGCIPWYLPHSSDSSVCDPWVTMEFRKLLENLQTNSSLCNHCLPDCFLTRTTASTSSARFRSL